MLLVQSENVGKRLYFWKNFHNLLSELLKILWKVLKDFSPDSISNCQEEISFDILFDFLRSECVLNVRGFVR